MANLIKNLKILLMILIVDKVYCEIIPIHIGNPNHRHFVRTTPNKNEEHLRASGLISVKPINNFNQKILIPPSQNFEYSKRIGMPVKRATYDSRNLIDHSNNPHSQTNSFYEREKQRIFSKDSEELTNPNNYRSNFQQLDYHQPQNYGYIPSNANNYNSHSQYDFTRSNIPSYNQQYTPNHPYNGNNQYNQQYTPNQPNQHYDQHAQYDQQRDKSPDYNLQNSDYEKELNDVGMDNSFYDMPSFDQSDNSGGQLFNDPMNFDSYFV